MPKGNATWLTPVHFMKNREETWSRLENSGWSHSKVDTSKSISFFNNPFKSQHTTPEYDLFFSYTKIFPLWDQRKHKDNCRHLADIRENIYQQEKDKAVPVLTSYTYGLPSRPFFDHLETRYRRINAIGNFKRRRGVMKVEEKEPQ